MESAIIKMEGFIKANGRIVILKDMERIRGIIRRGTLVIFLKIRYWDKGG